MRIKELKEIVTTRRQNELSKALNDFPMIADIIIPKLSREELNDLIDSLYPICNFSKMGLIYRFNLYNRTSESRSRLMECAIKIGGAVHE